MNLMEKKIYGSLVGGLIGDAMGAPCEDGNYWEIEERYGWVSDFDGAGTDDSAIKQILCDAIIKNNGHVTADQWAQAFLEHKEYYNLFFIPVKNMFHKIESGLELPVYCGIGNMQSSSSAMSIAPLGLINACNPYLASLQTYDAAGLVHGGSSTFCRDGAQVIAAAVAAAMIPGISPEEVVRQAVSFLHPQSSCVLIERIEDVLKLVDEVGHDYFSFRSRFYESHLQDIVSDSRETIPCTLALFLISDGDVRKAITYAANFGRDADTIGAMVGGLVGAYCGIDGIPSEWVEKVEANYGTVQKISKASVVTGVEVKDQRTLARQLYQIAKSRADMLATSCACFNEEEVCL